MSSGISEQDDITGLDVIAERTLTATIDDKSFDVFVRFGKPMPHPKGDWACPFQITGIGDEKVRHAFGIDAVQALQLAMLAAGKVLSTHRNEVKLFFLDENNLGFPRSTKEASGRCPVCGHGEAEC
jgi:hypothetical protein